MTLFAGVVALRRGQAVQGHFASTLARHLSRHPLDRPRLLSGEGYAVAHLDLGLIDGTTSLREDDTCITMLAGEPLLSHRAAPASRADDLDLLHHDAADNSVGALQRARGNFCLAHVDTSSRRVRLAADKLALRPLHYAVVDGLAVFATSLRVVLALVPHLANAGDLTAQAQLAALGHVLGARTAYSGIRCVEGGGFVDIDATGVHGGEYFRWDDVRENSADIDDFCSRLRSTFNEAVELRLGAQQRVTAHISGGLDSRCVVSVLRERATEVHSINFAPAGSADLVLGHQAAERLGTRHFEYPNGGTDFWDRMVDSHASWLGSLKPADRPPWPSRIWTGFAGETVLAPTNLTAPMLTALRDGRTETAALAYLNRLGGELSGRLFVPDRRQAMSLALRESVCAELARRTSADPARRMHVFQLLNEPRGNLARHHEDMDLRRLEFTIPYCDAELISQALSWQIEPLLRHHFYYRWLAWFPAAVREVPWQAYPWSEPCPVPIPHYMPTQWSDDWIDRKVARAELRQLTKQCESDLADPRFPADLLHRNNIRLVGMLTRLGFTRYAYLLRHARVFARYALVRPPRAPQC